MRRLRSGVAEFNGENNHVDLMVNFPPKVTLSKLVNSPKGVSSLKDAPGGTSRPEAGGEFPELVRHYWRTQKPWSGSYFAGSVGGAPIISVLHQPIEQQNRPI